MKLKSSGRGLNSDAGAINSDAGAIQKVSKGSGFFDDTESGAADLDATERPKQ